MAVRRTVLLTVAFLVASVATSWADEDVYRPDYWLVHDCIVSIQTARPEVRMTEKMFFAVMECEAFEADLTQAELEDAVPTANDEDEGAPHEGEPSVSQ